MAGMAGSYEGVELRKLPHRFRVKLSQILDVDNSWKKLMASIKDNAGLPKYTVEHMELVERHGIMNRRLAGDILLDEWSTSGRIRPTVETLYDLLQECQLFRAADYVALEILNIPIPERPAEGPAKVILPILNDEPESELQQRLNNIEIDSRTREPPAALNADSNLNILVQRLNNYDYSQGNLIDFSIEVIERATNKFDARFCIGSGAFGTVYSLDLKPKGPKLAIKLLHPASSGMEEQFVTEIRVLSEFRHENLVPLIGFCTNGPQFCLIYEFMSKGNLLEAIACAQNLSPLKWVQRISILCGVTRGLHYLHTAKAKPLIHRDIKSANVLLDDRFHAKIGDFGLAKSLNTSNQTSALTSTIFGTSAYMAPEAFRGDISPKMDIFSLGVIILELLTGLPPFEEEREGNDIVTYLEDVVEDDDIDPFLDAKAGSIDSTLASRIYSIALKCLSEKKRRPTSEQILLDIEAIATNSGTKNVL